ncbi:MAG TPA: hypothetical protein VF595_11165 [Tepidisphaeraceae bacterium]|jgi:hypothetical protein
MLVEDFAQPLSVAAAMVGFKRPWCVAGGWAIDLWLGQVTRDHFGVDIAVLRDHQLELRQHLAEFTFKIAATQGRPVVWKDANQMLMLPVHELFAADRVTGRAWRIFLDEADGIDWYDRRCADIRMNLTGWRWHGAANVPVLNPLIVLLHKSRRPEPKDELDFHLAVERLTQQQKSWLSVALLRVDAEHPWINLLSA